MEPSTKVNGMRKTKDKAVECRSGEMAQNMRVTGAKTRPTAKAASSTMTGACMMDSGSMIWLTAVVSISTTTALNTKVIGCSTSSMV